MGVLENLGSMPSPLSSIDKASIRGKMQEGRIFPNNSNGYFAPDGSFEFVTMFEFVIGRIGSINPFYVTSMWNMDLLGLCDQNHRLRLNTTAKKIVVFQKDNPKINPLIIQSENIRMIKKSDTGLTVVSEGGYILPPAIERMHTIGRRNMATETVLEEIKKGKSSKLFRDIGYPFERVLDPSLVGKPVTQIAFKLLLGEEDRVILCEGKLVERERVFPFLSQDTVDKFYR